MRVIICGAGIAGLSLAWWLGRDGWDVLIVERAPGLRGEGYIIDSCLECTQACSACAAEEEGEGSWRIA